MAEEHQLPTDATDIGLKLVGHSKSTEFTANRGLVIELFPFIFEASQRMSARAISRFLIDEQGVKLSAVTITKALNDPKKSWNSFFDIVEPSALAIAKWWRCETLNFLFAGKARNTKGYNQSRPPGIWLRSLPLRWLSRATSFPLTNFSVRSGFASTSLPWRKRSHISKIGWSCGPNPRRKRNERQ